MNQLTSWTRRVIFAATLIAAPFANAQAAPTAVQQLQLSAFGGGSGVFTRFYNGHNLGLTVGADLSFLSWHGYHPAIEVRGTYPVYSGTISSQKSFLGGIKVERTFNRLRPYGDFLIGRGQIDYQNGGFTVSPLTYISSTSTVYSFGGGVDYDLTRQWAAKADYQFQTWKTPIAPYTTIHPSNVTLGVVYRFDFNHHYRRVKAAPPAATRPPAPVPPPPPPTVQPDTNPPPAPAAQPDATPPPPPPANAPPQ